MTYSEDHEAYIKEHGDIQPDEDFEMDLPLLERRKLWLLSRGKCTLCKCDLYLKEHKTYIGAECHISSHKPDYPSKEFNRYDPNLTEKQRDKSYDNAILLCRNCHIIIDNPENMEYTIERLHQIKDEHEAEMGKKLTEDLKEIEAKGELEQKMIIHSKILASEELKPMTYTHIGFDFSGKLVINDPGLFSKQNYEDYYSEVDEHLKEGYPEVWEHKTNVYTFFNNHNKLLLEIVKETTDNVLNEIKKKILNLVDWDGEDQKPERYFSTKYISLNIQGIIQSSYDRIFEMDKYCCVINDESRWKVIIDYHLERDLLFRLPAYKSKFDNFLVFINGTPLAGSDNESEILTVKQIIISILKDAFTKEDFSRLKIYKKDAESEYNLFLKGVTAIIKMIEHNIPLKEKCEICKNY